MLRLAVEGGVPSARFTRRELTPAECLNVQAFGGIHVAEYGLE